MFQSIFFFRYRYGSLFGLLLVLFGCNRVETFDTQTNRILRPITRLEGNSSNGDNLIIGSVLAMSGAAKPWGDEALKGIKLAYKHFIQKGGIPGKNIELVFSDSNSKPEVGASAAESLISKGVLGIIGELTSGISAQVAHTTFSYGIPTISIGGTEESLTDIGNTIYRVAFTDAVQGKVMAKFAYNDLGLRRVALLIDRVQPYSTGISKSFQYEFAKLGGEVCNKTFYESGSSLFTSQLTNIKSSKPDGLFIGGYYMEVGSIIRQTNDIGLDVPVFGTDGWDTNKLIVAAGNKVFGNYFSTHYCNDDTRVAYQQFLYHWQQEYGVDPKTITAVLGYDAASVMFDALSRCRIYTSRELNYQIESTKNFTGASGDFSYTEMKGNPPKRILIVEVTPRGNYFRKFYLAN